MTRIIPHDYEHWINRPVDALMDEEKVARRLESQLRDMVKQWHYSEPMTAATIEPKIRETAEKYRIVAGREIFYSLARRDD